MKNKILKLIYIFLVIADIGAFAFLIIKPIQKSTLNAYYDAESDMTMQTFSSSINEKIKITKDKVFGVTFFVDSSVNENFDVIIEDTNKNILHKETYREYDRSIVTFQVEGLEKDKEYTLKIKDIDNNNLLLPVLDRIEDAYIMENNAKSLKLLIYNLESSYNYIWYPIFLLTFLFTVHPFVWEVENEK